MEELALLERLKRLGFDVPASAIDSLTTDREVEISVWANEAWLYMSDIVDWQLEPVPREIIDFALPTTDWQLWQDRRTVVARTEIAPIVLKNGTEM